MDGDAVTFGVLQYREKSVLADVGLGEEDGDVLRFSFFDPSIDRSSWSSEVDHGALVRWGVPFSEHEGGGGSVGFVVHGEPAHGPAVFLCLAFEGDVEVVLVKLLRAIEVCDGDLYPTDGIVLHGDEELRGEKKKDLTPEQRKKIVSDILTMSEVGPFGAKPRHGVIAEVAKKFDRHKSTILRV